MNTMMRIILCAVMVLTINIANAQSKKEQIKNLTISLDSLNQVVSNERHIYKQEVQSKDAEISSQKNQIDQLNLRNDSLNQVVSANMIQLNNLQNRINTIQQELTTSNQKLTVSENQIDSLKKELTSNKKNIENALTQNKVLSQQIISFKKAQLRRNCSSAVGNSYSNYPIRVSGKANGCIGCGEEIPTDLDLHKAILLLSNDYNSDTIIDRMDLELAIEKTGDVNQDSNIDIYDIVYPEVLKYTEKVENPFLILNNGSEYTLTGVIILRDGRYIIKLPSSIEMENNYDGYKASANEIDLSVSANIVVYRNKTVVLKGELLSGYTKAYINGFIFRVNQIMGAVK